jgi:hypothetical protein
MPHLSCHAVFGKDGNPCAQCFVSLSYCAVGQTTFKKYIVTASKLQNLPVPIHVSSCFFEKSKMFGRKGKNLYSVSHEGKDWGSNKVTALLPAIGVPRNLTPE